MSNEQKESKVVVKDGAIKFGREDWRGLIAVIFTVGFLGCLAWSLQFNPSMFDHVVAVLAPLDALIIDWYFRGKARRGE